MWSAGGWAGRATRSSTPSSTGKVGGIPFQHITLWGQDAQQGWGSCSECHSTAITSGISTVLLQERPGVSETNLPVPRHPAWGRGRLLPRALCRLVPVTKNR